MGGVSAFIPAVLQGASVAVQHQRAKAQANQVAAQNQILEQQQKQREKQQRDLLARQMATARARLASGGILDSGSGQALLSGMARQTEDDIAGAASLNRMRQDLATSQSSASGLEKALSLYQDASSIYDKLPRG